MTIEESLQTAAEHHDAGRLAEAEPLYRDVIARDPGQTDALHYLALLCMQLGRNAEALELLDKAAGQRAEDAELHAARARVLSGLDKIDDAVVAWETALRLQPEDADGQFALGVLYWRMRRKEQAAEALGAAVRVMPDHADAWINLGVALAALGRFEQAAEAHQRAIALRPATIELHCSVASNLREAGKLDEALAFARQAVDLRPDFAPAHNCLGLVLQRLGQVEPAIAAFRRAIELQPKQPKPYHNLANILREIHRTDDSIAVCRTLLEIAPENANAWDAMGNALYDQRLYEESIAAHRKALALDPRHPGALHDIGNPLISVGQTAEAIDSFKQSLAIRPSLIVHGSLLYSIWFDARFDAAAILREHREWNERYAKPLVAQIRPHMNDRSPDRRLRIGYVSPHLGLTTVGWNILPLVAGHDRAQFEVFCYSSLSPPDAMTKELARRADQWREIASLSDEQTAELIRADKIDVLIDLAVHAPGNRLLAFARRPAPVQATYLGYCGTTGMDAMDYRLSDRFFDPPGSEAGRYSEQTIRLPSGYWAYEPCGPLPDVGPLPALSAGYITFGSMNAFAKASPATRDLRARVLLAVPGSRMLIHAPAGSYREPVRQRFVELGVAGERIQFQEYAPWTGYIATYNRFDIALDSLPNNGGIATCDALMMGVPLVTLVGNTSVGRAGSSILNNVGLPELIARTPEQFVANASGLARDLPRLAELRGGLRQRVNRSPLRDHKSFVRDVEAAYRKMWQDWCRPKIAG